MFIFSRIKELEERVGILEGILVELLFDDECDEEEEVVVKKKRGRPRKK